MHAQPLSSIRFRPFFPFLFPCSCCFLWDDAGFWWWGRETWTRSLSIMSLSMSEMPSGKRQKRRRRWGRRHGCFEKKRLVGIIKTVQDRGLDKASCRRKDEKDGWPWLARRGYSRFESLKYVADAHRQCSATFSAGWKSSSSRNCDWWFEQNSFVNFQVNVRPPLSKIICREIWLREHVQLSILLICDSSYPET